MWWVVTILRPPLGLAVGKVRAYVCDTHAALAQVATQCDSYTNQTYKVKAGDMNLNQTSTCSVHTSHPN